MNLRAYVRKRRFDETPEPSGQRTAYRKRKAPIFVVQLHHARSRHYDFRLEVDGTLKSWAVPKGPSLRPGDKRLAVEVEDHPLAYATFAGDIPAGHYGAGHVDIFDRGTWQPESEPRAALATGHLDFELRGDKLRGRWTLVRTRLRGTKPQWLLIKRNDGEARDAEADDWLDQGGESAARRSLDPDCGNARSRQRPAPETRRAPRRTRAQATKGATAAAAADRWRARALALHGARARALPAGFKPALCTLQSTPPSGDEWLHETKWDGYRLLADLDGGRVALRSRNDLDWTAKFPEIAAAIEALPVSSARLDGELIALDRNGNSDFSALQRALEAGASATLRYMVFDLPALEKVDLRQVALIERKALLESLLLGAKHETLAFSPHVVGRGAEAFAAARRNGLEGIVSKRRDAPYVEGRTRAWLKIKLANTDEFVVVGYTSPRGARSGFGSLLLATAEHGGWRYVGRVGSGFSAALLASMTPRLQALARAEPSVTLPAHVPFRASAVHWVEPNVVVEVAFRGWAKEGLLRQASFQRLREDKTTEDFGMPTKRKRSGTSRARASAAATRAERAKETRPAANAGSGRDEVTITHPDRIVFPDTTITKQAVADYYRAVAEWMLPELVDRPLSVLRCPEGAGTACFFQKHHAAALGANVAAITLREKSGASDEYLYVTDLHGVLELVQMNVLEFHPWGARIDAPDQPDRLVFDLDPGPGVDWKALVAAAREVRERLAETGLESFVRLSGGKGAHVVVPIRRGPDWDQAKAFCEAFARAMAARTPQTYLATASKAKRDGRIFIDWLRNARGATSVAGWSLRARAGAPVAMPLRWEEFGRVEGAVAFDLAAARRRARSLRTDPWPNFAQLAQRLPALDPG